MCVPLCHLPHWPLSLNNNNSSNNNDNNNHHNHNNNNNRIQRRYSRFFTFSSLRREPSLTRTLKWPGRKRVESRAAHRGLITCSTSSAYHVQHIERLSRAACRFTCHVVRRDSSAIKFEVISDACVLSNSNQ